jgi:hypothetical protein
VVSLSVARVLPSASTGIKPRVMRVWRAGPSPLYAVRPPASPQWVSVCGAMCTQASRMCPDVPHIFPLRPIHHQQLL